MRERIFKTREKERRTVRSQIKSKTRIANKFTEQREREE